MAERRMCDVCGVRPAVTTVRRIAPGEPARTEYLCEVHAAQARGGRTPFGGRPSLGGGGSLFDDFFNRFFDEGPGGRSLGAPAGRAAQRSGARDNYLVCQ
jgi:ATP-dependent Clp protease ATP-binding subunit ClpC